MKYERMVEKIIPMYSYQPWLLSEYWDIIGLYTRWLPPYTWSMMVMFVEFSYRQPKHERRLIRIMTLVVIIFLGFSCLFGAFSPAYALSLDYEYDNGQIIWTWEDGKPPYRVWDSNGLIADDYPYNWMITDVEPGKTYTLAVEDVKTQQTH